MPRTTIREAHRRKDLADVRRLMREYGQHLASNSSGAASICLEGYEQELACLPEGYAVILLAEVGGIPAGCVALREIARPERPAK